MKAKKQVKMEEHDKTPFKVASVAGCCGVKLLHGFKDSFSGSYDQYEVPATSPFKGRVKKAAGVTAHESDEYYNLVAITNSYDQPLAEVALRKAGFGIAKRFRGTAGDDLILWFRHPRN
jgi:hypothetical protein